MRRERGNSSTPAECEAVFGLGFLEKWRSGRSTYCSPLPDTDVASSVECFVGCVVKSNVDVHPLFPL